MIGVDRWIESSGFDITLIMQVHDELVFEVHKDLVDEVKLEIDRLMTQVAKLQVPLVVDMGSGKNWDEAH